MSDISIISDKLGKLAVRAELEFERVSDFVWKSPRLIEHETKLELSKLDAYFSNHPDLREIRWEAESRKLKQTFPYLIVVGNLFSVLSVFESYLLLLAGELQNHTGIPLHEVKGQGVSKLFNYFKLVGIPLHRIPLHQQIQAAIRIRNCITHASGMLAWSRDAVELRRIQTTGTYLSPEHRKMRIDRGREFDEVRLVRSGLGDRMMVDNKYCHVLCHYLASFFVALCQIATKSLQPQEA